MVESLFELGYGKYRADTMLKKTKTTGHSRVHCSLMTKPHVLGGNTIGRAILVARPVPSKEGLEGLCLQ
jgi:hypothetical protein